MVYFIALFLDSVLQNLEVIMDPVKERHGLFAPEKKVKIHVGAIEGIDFKKIDRKIQCDDTSWAQSDPSRIDIYVPESSAAEIVAKLKNYPGITSVGDEHTVCGIAYNKKLKKLHHQMRSYDEENSANSS